MDRAIQRELGTISAKQDFTNETLHEMKDRLKGMDDRLRKVETRSAINGAVTGGIMAVAVAFIKDAFKA